MLPQLYPPVAFMSMAWNSLAPAILWFHKPPSLCVSYIEQTQYGWLVFLAHNLYKYQTVIISLHINKKDQPISDVMNAASAQA